MVLWTGAASCGQVAEPLAAAAEVRPRLTNHTSDHLKCGGLLCGTSKPARGFGNVGRDSRNVCRDSGNVGPDSRNVGPQVVYALPLQDVSDILHEVWNCMHVTLALAPEGGPMAGSAPSLSEGHARAAAMLAE
jgi:hypothetical protein